MRHVLTEQLVQKVLSQGTCCPSCSDTNAQGTEISNDETSDKQINKVKNQVVDVVSKGRAVLACGLLIKLGGRLAKDKSHQRKGGTNGNGTCDSKSIKYPISRAGIREDAL
jgi:hypothetical protein